MADSPPVNRQMLTAMAQLTSELRRLGEHMQDADKAAVQRGREVANAQSVAARSQITVPNLPGVPQVGSVPNLSASTPDRIAATMSEAAARTALSQQQSATNRGESVPPGTTAGGGQPEEDPSSPSDAEALTFAMLGTHGGPFGRLRMQQYMLQRNIAWGASTTNALGQWLGGRSEATDSGTMAGAYDTLQAGSNFFNKKLQWAQTGKGQWATLGALGAYRGGEHVINAITNWQQAGRELGFGNQQNTGFFGLRNPFSQWSATKEGASLALEREALMGRLPGMGFGAGLSKDDAKAAVGTLAAQGFSNEGVSSLNPFKNMVNGDNIDIAQNLLRPLMNMGLTAQDAAQWTPALRNSSVAMQQLMDSLTNLPTAAKTAKQTVADLNAQLIQVGETLVQHGGTLQKGAEVGLAWESGTGMQPAIAGQLMQNPIYQGLMMGRYGVLPSGIGDLPGGAQAQGMLSMFNLLRNATSGLNHDKYANVPGIGRELIARGSQLQDSQIAQMMGISRAEVDRLRRQSQHAGAIETTMTALGSSDDHTGLFDPKMSDARRQQIWQKMVTDRQGALGLSAAQMRALKTKDNLPDRFKLLQKDLLGNHAKDPSNQVTVHVKFTGAAAKVFQQDGKAGLALMANSGGNAQNNTINSPYGDALAATAASHLLPGDPSMTGTPMISNPNLYGHGQH